MNRKNILLPILLVVACLSSCGGNSSSTGSSSISPSSSSQSTTTDVPPGTTKYTVNTVGWSIAGGTNFANSAEARNSLQTILDDGHNLISSIEVPSTNNSVLSQIFGENESSVGFTFGSKKLLGEMTINFNKKLKSIKLDCVGFWKTWTSSGGGQSYDTNSTLEVYVNGQETPQTSIICIQPEEGQPAVGVGEISDNNGYDKITLKNLEVTQRVVINSIEFGY